MRKKLLLASLLTISSLVLLHPYVYTNSTGAPTGHTGAPGESNCAQSCHTGNSLNSSGGDLQIKIMDNGTEVQDFINGKTYTVQVSLSKSGAKAFGFQVTAKGTNAGAGTFATGGNTDVRKDLNYITHQNATPSETGKDIWTCQWTAPASGAGDVIFYASGNAANGNGNSLGDFIYTTSKRLGASATSLDEKSIFAHNLRMYPNPVQNVLSVEFTVPGHAQKLAVLEVYSLEGKLLHTEIQQTKAFSGNTIYADLSGYKKGVYLVKLNVGEYAAVKKVLKQ